MNEFLSSFKLICRVLCISLSTSQMVALRDELKNGLVCWQTVSEMANHYLVAPAFWAGVVAKDLLPWLPESPARYFKEIFQLNRTRNSQLRRQMLEAVSAMQNVGIQTILLKGAAQLAQPIHTDIGCRIMTDLDILIEEDRYALAYDTLRKLGYQPLKLSYDPNKHHHYCPVYRTGDFGRIELHRHAVHLKNLPLLPTPDVWNNSQAVTVDGITVRLPSPTHAVLINILHSQVGDRYHHLRQINLRALLDFAALQRYYADTIQWAPIRQVFIEHHLKSVLDGYLLGAHRLLNAPVRVGYTPGFLGRIQYLVCLAAVRWFLVDAVMQRADALSAEMICKLFKCPSTPFPITAYRCAYIFRYLRNRFFMSPPADAAQSEK